MVIWSRKTSLLLGKQACEAISVSGKLSSAVNFWCFCFLSSWTWNFWANYIHFWVTKERSNVLCCQPSIILLDQIDVSGVENKQGCSLKLPVKEYAACSFLLWILSSGGVRYEFLLFKLPWWNWAQERLKLTVVFSKPVSLIAVACQKRQIRSWR